MKTNRIRAKQNERGDGRKRKAKPLRELPTEGLVRLNQILAVLPIGKTTFYELIKQGYIPKPTFPLGPRIAVWNVKDIRAFWEKRNGTDNLP